MDTEEVSDRFVAPCFVNGLEAYDEEINLALIIKPKEYDVEPGVILGRTFLRMTKAITDFEAGTVIIYPEFDPFLEDIKEEEKSLDDWDHVRVTTIIAKFLILDIPIYRDALIVVGRGFLTAESDSDDEEEYQIKRNKFRAPIYGPKPAPYLNCNDPAERSLALQAVINPFWNISVWKKAMDTEEVSDRFIAPCFVNGLEAYDEEINLAVEENMISNKYAVKLCLEHEVKRRNKVVKKELIVTLTGEIYFVKLIINPKEYDVEPGVILGRTFLRMTKAITDFEAGTVIIYPEFDPFLEDIKEEEKSLDDWDHVLDFNLDHIPLLGEKELPPFVCKMGKSNHNKKRSMENLSLFYQDIGTSSSAGGHLTQEESTKEALAIRISQKFALLEEVRHVIETRLIMTNTRKLSMRFGKTR
nr:hypothetical protein [Tanacetum cinerariifolium]